MGSGKGNAQLKAEQKQASSMALPNADLSAAAKFDVKGPIKLVKYDKGSATAQSGFNVEQNGVVFGFGSFASQYGAASQFDQTKAFSISGGKDTPILKQGGLSFAIPNPVALSLADAPKDTSAEDKTLPRVPRDVATGQLAGTASARALSGSDYARTSATGLKRPMLAGIK